MKKLKAGFGGCEGGNVDAKQINEGKWMDIEPPIRRILTRIYSMTLNKRYAP